MSDYAPPWSGFRIPSSLVLARHCRPDLLLPDDEVGGLSRLIHLDAERLFQPMIEGDGWGRGRFQLAPVRRLPARGTTWAVSHR
jgi:hypothetical protein